MAMCGRRAGCPGPAKPRITVPGQAFSRRVPARVRWGSSVIAAAPALTRAVHVRPLLAGRGYATPQGQRLSTLADVFAYATACGIRLRIDGSEIQVRRPRAS